MIVRGEKAETVAATDAPPSLGNDAVLPSDEVMQFSGSKATVNQSGTSKSTEQRAGERLHYSSSQLNVSPRRNNSTSWTFPHSYKLPARSPSWSRRACM